MIHDTCYETKKKRDSLESLFIDPFFCAVQQPLIKSWKLFLSNKQQVKLHTKELTIWWMMLWDGSQRKKTKSQWKSALKREKLKSLFSMTSLLCSRWKVKHLIRLARPFSLKWMSNVFSTISGEEKVYLSRRKERKLGLIENDVNWEKFLNTFVSFLTTNSTFQKNSSQNLQTTPRSFCNMRNMKSVNRQTKPETAARKKLGCGCLRGI